MLSQEQAAERLGQLTAKQVEVLDMLVGHQTTKEIARELRLAPNTIDQRITAAREKWGLPNRKALIRLYAELQEICGKTTYGSAPLDDDKIGGERVDNASTSGEKFIRPHAKPPVPHVGSRDSNSSEPPFVLQHSDIRFGRLGRVGIALIFALAIALTLAASLAVAEAMGHWL